MRPHERHPWPQADLVRAASHVSNATWSSLDGKRIFVTGGTGFVGKWLLAALDHAQERLGFHCETVLLSRDPSRFESLAPAIASAPGRSLWPGDVRRFDSPPGEFDIILHAATDVASAAGAMDVFETCVEGTRRVLDFATSSGTTHLLFLSSGAIYGFQPADMDGLPETFTGAPDPLSAGAGYGNGKRAAEWLCAAWSAEQLDRRVSIARLFSVMGPGMPLSAQFAAGNFMCAAIAGEPIILQGDGKAVRSYLHVADAAGWLWNIFFHGNDVRAYNVGGSKPISTAELAKRISASVQKPVQVEMLGQSDSGLAPSLYYPDVSRSKLELGLRELLTLEETIQSTADWHDLAAKFYVSADTSGKLTRSRSTTNGRLRT